MKNLKWMITWEILVLHRGKQLIWEEGLLLTQTQEIIQPCTPSVQMVALHQTMQRENQSIEAFTARIKNHAAINYRLILKPFQSRLWSKESYIIQYWSCHWPQQDSSDKSHALCLIQWKIFQLLHCWKVGLIQIDIHATSVKAVTINQMCGQSLYEGIKK